MQIWILTVILSSWSLLLFAATIFLFRWLREQRRESAIWQSEAVAREQEAVRREEDAARRERAVASREQELTRQGAWIARREQDVAGREHVTVRREREIAGRERDIATREREAARRESEALTARHQAQVAQHRAANDLKCAEDEMKLAQEGRKRAESDRRASEAAVRAMIEWVTRAFPDSPAREAIGNELFRQAFEDPEQLRPYLTHLEQQVKPESSAPMPPPISPALPALPASHSSSASEYQDRRVDQLRRTLRALFKGGRIRNGQGGKIQGLLQIVPLQCRCLFHPGLKRQSSHGLGYEV